MLPDREHRAREGLLRNPGLHFGKGRGETRVLPLGRKGQRSGGMRAWRGGLARHGGQEKQSRRNCRPETWPRDHAPVIPRASRSAPDTGSPSGSLNRSAVWTLNQGRSRIASPPTSANRGTP